jgi:hypothetical protein
VTRYTLVQGGNEMQNVGFVRPIKRPNGFIPMYWGDGSDGILSAGETYQAGVDFDKYAGFCIKQFSSINWDPASSETLTVDEPCRGLILFVYGDVYVGSNATISMAKMGSVLPANPSELIDLYHESAQMRHIIGVLKTLQGGAGGDGGRGGSYSGGTSGIGGIGGTGRICQGRRGAGPGGVAFGNLGGDGGDVIYPECGQQNGYNCDNSNANGADGWNGGAGGMAYPGSATFPTSPGRSYGAGPRGGSLYGPRGGDGEHTGGFILIIAKGNITIAGTI